MTEYQETKQDREDAAKLADLDEVLRKVQDARNALRDGTPDGYMVAALNPIDEAAGDVDVWVQRQRARIIAEGEARIAAFYTDRAKVKRAFAALRKLGIATSMTEPGYESSRDYSLPIAEATQSDGMYAFARRPHVEHSFGDERDRFGGYDKSRTGDTLRSELCVYWGSQTDTEETFAIGSTIAAAFADEGLNVEWDGRYADAVTIQPSA